MKDFKCILFLRTSEIKSLDKHNIYLTYCLTRFSKNIAAAGGFTSGGSYIVTSVISLSVVNIIYVDKPQALAICYFMVAILILGGLLNARKA